MLRGDLATTPLAAVLTTLAEQGATGCLHVEDGSGDEALVYLKQGRVYSAYAPGRRPQLGARLISSGALAPEALEEALEAQATELQGWRLGELLVHLGYVDRGVVEAFVLEQLHEACTDLARWTTGAWKFRKNEKTREELGTPADVATLLAELARREQEWELIAGTVHGSSAVPVLSSGRTSAAELSLDQDQWALLCKVDGERTIAQLARDCGFTSFEAGRIVYSLVSAGLLEVVETVLAEPDDDARWAPATAAASIAAMLGADPPGSAEADVPDDAATTVARISSALFLPLLPTEPEPEPEPYGDETEAGAFDLTALTATLADLPQLGLPSSLEPAQPFLDADPVPAVPEDGGFADSLARVSEALSALLGDGLVQAEPSPAPPEVVDDPAMEEAARQERERRERSRAAAAAELAQAHALAEAERAESERAEAERAEAERLAAEEAIRVEAERLAEEEQARLEAERLAAEAERVEAERVEAERVEAERVEAERLAAEEAERVEAERLAAEEAERVEAERLAAEEAERVEAERLRAEAAARLAAEHAEAARVEAETVAETEAVVEAVELDPREAFPTDLTEVITEIAEPVDVAVEAARLVAALAAEDFPAEPPQETPPAEPTIMHDLGDIAEPVEDPQEPSPPAPPAEPATGTPGLSDTAALLRELSSLGLDDDAQPASAGRLAGTPVPRQAPPGKDQPKKRKGLFGRG